MSGNPFKVGDRVILRIPGFRWQITHPGTVIRLSSGDSIAIIKMDRPTRPLTENDWYYAGEQYRTMGAYDPRFRDQYMDEICGTDGLYVHIADLLPASNVQTSHEAW